MVTDLQKRTAQAIVNVFETGRARGDYGKVTLIPGDTGHLTYGRSQTTLASGNLHLLIKAYCAAPGAALAGRLRPYLGRLAGRDTTLDHHLAFRRLLEDAGEDVVMREAQDRFFDRVYWTPSLAAAGRAGIGTALGTAVVYDSHVHGAWGLVRTRTEARHGAVGPLDERAWVGHYVAERREWLATHPRPVLHLTVYRMDAFGALIAADAWALPLPLSVRGVRLDEESLDAPASTRASALDARERTLLLRKPPLRGPDVEAVQRALRAAGLPVKVDGAYGPRTAAAVREFQQQRGLVIDGIVGPATRTALGLG